MVSLKGACLLKSGVLATVQYAIMRRILGFKAKKNIYHNVGYDFFSLYLGIFDCEDVFYFGYLAAGRVIVQLGQSNDDRK